MRIRRSVLGFTLTEILIAGVIMAVLAGLAVPAYFRTMEQSRSNEALSNLAVIHMGQKIYRINNGTFWNGGNGLAVGVINTALNIDISAVYYTTIDITAVAGTSYTAKLTRNNVSGGAGTKWYQYFFTNGSAAPVQTEGGAF
jgi:type II secretory pathway pseudopilin PulG